MFGLRIDRDSSLSVTRQLYHQLRQMILDGQMPAGTKLPPTRTLAGQLGIARNVAVEVYEALQFEGFLDSRQGSFTFVSQDALLAKLPALPFATTDTAATNPDLIDFRFGVPDLRYFPRKHWKDALFQVILDAPAQNFGYTEVAGCSELRTVLPAFLFQSRGVSCSSEQIVITSGSTQALALAIRLLASRNRKVLCEDPLNAHMKKYITSLGCSLAPLPVDRQGLQTELLSRHIASPPAFTLVTPSHQFPTGGILPVQRRIQLIRFARNTNSFIMEDDYENEFSQGRSSVSSLQGLDPETVLYSGTFSKTLAPALRLGYLVLPRSLVHLFHKTDWFSPQQPSTLDQLALSSLIAHGRLQQHIMKMNKIYQKKRQLIIRELQQHFGARVTLPDNSTGLHITAEFAGINFTPSFAERIAKEYAVRIYPVAEHAEKSSKALWLQQAIFGYGNLSEPQIVEGVARFARSIPSLGRKSLQQ